MSNRILQVIYFVWLGLLTWWLYRLSGSNDALNATVMQLGDKVKGLTEAMVNTVDNVQHLYRAIKK